MPSTFIPAERRRLIRELVCSQGVVRVVDLSKRLGVSEITVRRDLETLEGEGVLERTHGGAIYSQMVSRLWFRLSSTTTSRPSGN